MARESKRTGMYIRWYASVREPPICSFTAIIMCGIAGVWHNRLPSNEVPQIVRAMTDELRHRGPDAEGIWHDETLGLALGHRRLAIVDLSPSGAQPMRSASGRFTIVFNGEIYNFKRLRAELEATGAQFEGTSDTAVMLAAFEAWGITASVPRFHGMFAFAVWDQREQCLWLGRDRLGEKPLYITEVDDAIAFASELKALRQTPMFRSDVDPHAVFDVLKRGTTRGCRTIYASVKKLLPGQLVKYWRVGTALRSQQIEYWSVTSAAAVAKNLDLTFQTDENAIDALDQLLSSVVTDEMISDVALGAFLSGGVDSSLIVALMQRASSRPVRTFTIGFNEATHDESPFARGVAAHVGTEHTEVMLSARDALSLVPRLPEIFDEPFADSSQLPMLLVADVTRRSVTVAISGDGGDELFGGYSQYAARDGLATLVGRVPRFAKSAIAGGLGFVPDAVLRSASKSTWTPNFRSRLHALLTSDSAALSYDALLAMIVSPEGVLARDQSSIVAHPSWPSAPTFAESQMMFDLQTYLPDDILVKVDRSAMAYSLETRAPLLDHRVVEFALAQPLHRKIRNGRGKYLLRALLVRYIPLSLIDRPKRGFSIPLGDWLRRDLRSWGYDMLTPDNTLRQWFNPQVTSALWAEHQRGDADRSQQLWPILMLLQWLRTNAV